MKLKIDSKKNLRPLFANKLETDIEESNILLNTSYFYDVFCENYLGQLLNHHSFANDDYTCLLGIYENSDDASVYITTCRYLDILKIKSVFQEALDFCFKRGKSRFYMILPSDYSNFKEHFINQHEHYNFYTDFIVKAKNKCKYTDPWQILFNRKTYLIDTKVISFCLKENLRGYIDGGFE